MPMQGRIPSPDSPGAANPRCQHHWIIDTPNGPTTTGVCKLCGARRQFRTSSDDYIQEGRLQNETAVLGSGSGTYHALMSAA